MKIQPTQYEYENPNTTFTQTLDEIDMLTNNQNKFPFLRQQRTVKTMLDQKERNITKLSYD